MLGIFLTAGYPTVDKSIQALKILDELAVDLIELGVPFSDPLADGPVIQKSSFQALENGVSLDKVFEIYLKAKKGSTATQGLANTILFSYYNPLYSYGFDKLMAKCKETGIKGALIPDLPMDESYELSELFAEQKLDIVNLVAPTSTAERKKQIAALSRPFIYLVSRIGTTGSGEDFQERDELKAIIAELKTYTKKPIAVGFGIDSREKVEQVLGLGADMAIVGSKAVTVLAEDDTADLSKFREFIASLII